MSNPTKTTCGYILVIGFLQWIGQSPCRRQGLVPNPLGGGPWSSSDAGRCQQSAACSPMGKGGCSRDKAIRQVSRLRKDTVIVTLVVAISTTGMFSEAKSSVIYLRREFKGAKTQPR